LCLPLNEEEQKIAEVIAVLQFKNEHLAKENNALMAELDRVKAELDRANAELVRANAELDRVKTKTLDTNEQTKTSYYNMYARRGK
jgi:uncharacterized Zn finger protein